MDSAPRFSRKPMPLPAARARRWQWWLAALLLLMFVVQVTLAARADLARDARWRPWVSALCNVLACEVPAWREPGAFAMLRRDVHPVADVPGVLQVQAVFRNDARWPQAWPVLHLRLSDADGRVTGEHDFTPHQYLPAGGSDTLLIPGQSAQIDFLIQEPAAGTAAFSFDFR